MRNIALLLALLVGPYIVLAPFGMSESFGGRIGISCVFLVTGLAHFFQASPMSEMIPRQFPARSRLPIIYVSGVIELLAVVGILIPSWHRLVGVLLCAFLVLVLPTNIESAIRRVPFGGHSAGPVYLLVRIPFQLALIGWVYWFAIHDNI
jgi:uncharacterized membrane protein